VRVRPFSVIAVAILALLASAGCGGSKSASKPPAIQQAQGFADGFVHRLVVVGRWSAIENDIPPLQTRSVRGFQDSLRKDGVRQVIGHGVVRHDCPPSPTVNAGKDCFAYHLRGRHVVPTLGATVLNSQLRLWVTYVGGHWQFANYDYTLQR
jgi:hypothetical protein